jgi:glyoxylate/hydroxypyruvate reductase A
VTKAPVTVVIASPLEHDLVERLRAAISGSARVIYEPALLPVARFAGAHHGARPELDQSARDRWLGLLAQAEVLLDFDWLAPAELPRNAPRLRWLQATSSGIGEFMAVNGLADRGFIVTTAAGIHARPLAEFVLFALLYFVKDAPGLADAKAARRWQRHTSGELNGKRILIVGLGEVGTQAAASCAALGVEVWGVSRTPRTAPPEGVSRLVPRDGMRAALAEVDGLVLAAPHTAESHHLIGREELGQMPAGSILVNIGRGELVDEDALIDALFRNHLGGAALDVAATEPLPPGSPLWRLRNVLISPHSASTVAAENERIVELFLRNFRRFTSGEPLINLYEHARGY